MKGFKLLLGILIVFSLFSMVSANGIKISPANLSLNKTFGIDQSVQLIISNEEAFNFQNLQIEQSNIATIPLINLSSGENKTVTMTIKTNEDFNGNLNLIGYFEQNIGTSNRTFEVNIDYNNGLDVCDLDGIIGDSILWINNHNDEVDIKNTDTGEIIQTIQAGQSYLKTFGTPVQFSYQVLWITFPFTENCHINVQDDNGLVHSQDYDFPLDTKIKIIYEPTNVSMNFLITNYTINYSASREEIFSITNNGGKIAKNIHLSANWITFNKNDFDLNPSETTTVGYKIQPIILTTNETDKTYNIEVKAEGNFNTTSQTLFVFVPYFPIPSSTYSSLFDPEVIRNIYNLYCQAYPSDPICARFYSSSGGSETNVTFSAEAIQKLIEKYIIMSDNYNSLSKNQLESNEHQNQIQENQTFIDANQTQEIRNLNSQVDTLSSVLLFLAMLFIGVPFIAILIYMVFRSRDKTKRMLRFHKGELQT